MIHARADALYALAIVIATALIVVVPRAFARWSSHPSAAECEALLERYVELKERAISDKLDPKRHAAALEEARRAAGPSVDACMREVTLDELECTRHANHADEVERCLQ